MLMFRRIVLVCTLTLTLCQLIPTLSIAVDLTWTTSKVDAFELAQQQGKKVLLLAGRDT